MTDSTTRKETKSTKLYIKKTKNQWPTLNPFERTVQIHPSVALTADVFQYFL